MAGYVRKVEATVTFDSQQVGFTLKPLTYADLLLLYKDRGEQAEVLRQYQLILPRYIDRISPILDSANELVSVEEICTAAYFAPLVGLIMKAHVDAATVAAATPPSADQSAD